ncbi:hypothetical protein PUR61_09555 [Streptomyces sp. BE20]|uniref:hypothetical protein n=1 Tax=Streptomyces sp. BE20 TaxID=3002525 RepID=UPI002E79BA38|nr:hypothetical protein [Streptomyces sp. BE20]MEE1822435.1 hypothetical protein [Streptomyces sp. BE20]
MLRVEACGSTAQHGAERGASGREALGELGGPLEAQPVGAGRAGAGRRPAAVEGGAGADETRVHADDVVAGAESGGGLPQGEGERAGRDAGAAGVVEEGAQPVGGVGGGQPGKGDAERASVGAAVVEGDGDLGAVGAGGVEIGARGVVRAARAGVPERPLAAAQRGKRVRSRGGGGGSRSGAECRCGCRGEEGQGHGQRRHSGGATRLFELLLDRSPQAFQRFAEDYYEVPVDLEAVRDVYASRPLNQTLASSLNPEVDLTDVAEDIAEIGYPQPDWDRV